jgi:hypothetical protein
MDAAIADVHPVHDAVPYRRSALDDPPAHGSYVVTCAANDNAKVSLSHNRWRLTGTMHCS